MVKGLPLMSKGSRSLKRQLRIPLFICRRLHRLEFKVKLDREFNGFVERTGFAKALRMPLLLGYVGGLIGGWA